MQETTLCYIVINHQVLLLHRNKKANDPNIGKYLGIGGKIELNETLESAMKREVNEETQLDVLHYTYRGKVTFISDKYPSELMHLFLINQVSGSLGTCHEGELVWIDLNHVYTMPMWEGDIHFLKPLLESDELINMTLVYKTDTLHEVIHHA